MGAKSGKKAVAGASGAGSIEPVDAGAVKNGVAGALGKREGVNGGSGSAAGRPVEVGAGETERRVVASAVKLFSIKGYEGTSIREIIEDAGVTRPVVYYYFKNKEDLFCSIIEREFDWALGALDEIIAEIPSCRERLEALIGSVFERVERSPETVSMMLRFFFAPPDRAMRIDREAFGGQRYMRLMRIMQEGMDRGEIRAGDAASVAVAFSSLMDMHVIMRAGDAEAKLTREHGRGLVDLFFNGVNGNGMGPDTFRYFGTVRDV